MNLGLILTLSTSAMAGHLLTDLSYLLSLVFYFISFYFCRAFHSCVSQLDKYWSLSMSSQDVGIIPFMRFNYVLVFSALSEQYPLIILYHWSWRQWNLSHLFWKFCFSQGISNIHVCMFVCAHQQGIVRGERKKQKQKERLRFRHYFELILRERLDETGYL